MAIDTAAKRSSALLAGLPWRSILPLPDGVIGQGDRQHLANHYSGILAGELLANVVSGLEYVLNDVELHYTLPTGRLHYTVAEED